MRRPKDFTALGFTCFRLEPDGPDYTPVELLQASTRMFAFVDPRPRPRPQPLRRVATGGGITSPRRAALALLGKAR